MTKYIRQGCLAIYTGQGQGKLLCQILDYLGGGDYRIKLTCTGRIFQVPANELKLLKLEPLEGLS